MYNIFLNSKREFWGENHKEINIGILYIYFTEIVTLFFIIKIMHLIILIYELHSFFFF